MWGAAHTSCRSIQRGSSTDGFHVGDSPGGGAASTSPSSTARNAVRRVPTGQYAAPRPLRRRSDRGRRHRPCRGRTRPQASGPTRKAWTRLGSLESARLRRQRTAAPWCSMIENGRVVRGPAGGARQHESPQTSMSISPASPMTLEQARERLRGEALDSARPVRPVSVSSPAKFRLSLELHAGRLHERLRHGPRAWSTCRSTSPTWATHTTSMSSRREPTVCGILREPGAQGRTRRRNSNGACCSRACGRSTAARTLESSTNSHGGRRDAPTDED